MRLILQAALPARLRLLEENVMYDDQAQAPEMGNWEEVVLEQ